MVQTMFFRIFGERHSREVYNLRRWHRFYVNVQALQANIEGLEAKSWTYYESCNEITQGWSSQKRFGEI